MWPQDRICGDIIGSYQSGERDENPACSLFSSRVDVVSSRFLPDPAWLRRKQDSWYQNAAIGPPGEGKHFSFWQSGPG